MMIQWHLNFRYDLGSTSQARQFRLKIDPVRDAVARFLVQTGAASQIRKTKKNVEPQFLTTNCHCGE